jgi:predicted MFS family arabinose efflux permease
MMPFASSFALISVLYILRLGFRNTANPLLSSLFMRLLHEDEKSTASSLRQMAFQSGGVFAPWLGGQLMEVSLDLPVYVGVVIYVIFALSSYLLLRNEEGIVVKSTVSVH